jgi:hypothetical protein
MCLVAFGSAFMHDGLKTIGLVSTSVAMYWTHLDYCEKLLWTHPVHSREKHSLVLFSITRETSKLFGARCRYAAALACGGPVIHYNRLTVRCPVHDHCTKSRNTGEAQRRLHPLEPAAYIAAWIRSASAMTRAAHRKWQPSETDIRHELAHLSESP